MFRIILFAYLFQQSCNCNSIRASIYHRGSVCDLQMRMDNGCSEEVPGIDSVLMCVRQCGLQDSCIGASLDTDTNKCYLHQPCTPDIPCVMVETKHKYYTSHCVRGRWNTTTGSCDCFHGCHGDRCEKVFENCGGLNDAGYAAGTYLTYIDPGQDGNVLRVVCGLLPPSYWHIRMISNTGGLSSNRTWNEYLNGFFVDIDNYFSGLASWHTLSNNYNCGIMVVVLDFTDGSYIYHKYHGFVVGGEHQNYAFTYIYSTSHVSGTPSGSYTFGECFAPNEYDPFSTWDKNNGGGDCASRVGSGWWHPPQCDLPCNLLGWGLDDWDNVPVQQRLSVLGVDMDYAVSQSRVKKLYLYITEG